MPLTAPQQAMLDTAIQTYTFPCEHLEPYTHAQRIATSVRSLEAAIHAQLTSGIVPLVRHGLVNVVYWGNAGSHYQRVRAANANLEITAAHAEKLIALLAAQPKPTLRDIAELRIPYYSYVSFVSKLLMFIDPDGHCVLDRHLSRLAEPGGRHPLDKLKCQATYIPITSANQRVYDAWRDQCNLASLIYFEGRYRPVDVERGLFELARRNLPAARTVYRAL